MSLKLILNDDLMPVLAVLVCSLLSCLLYLALTVVSAIPKQNSTLGMFPSLVSVMSFNLSASLLFVGVFFSCCFV